MMTSSAGPFFSLASGPPNLKPTTGHMPWAPLWRGRKNCFGKIKIFIYSFLNLYFAPHAFINCTAASTPRPHLKHYVGRVAPLSIMIKLRYCDITQGSDISTEQECSLAMSTMPRPSHAIRKDKLVRTAAFQASRSWSDSR